MIAGRTIGGLVDPGTIEEMERDLTKVIDDFDRAVNLETLRRIKEAGKQLFTAIIHSQLYCLEQELLLWRLKSVDTTYHRNLGCMGGTREFLLKQLMSWATKASGQEESNTYWIYGLPGIGKTSLAHSICARLHEQSQLAGAFFCRRDVGNLSDPKNILPTLIHKLSIIFPPFRRLLAERLRNDPNLAPASMKDTLLLELIRKLPRLPKCTLIFVIDALDECGNTKTRLSVLRALTDAATHAPWLKVIITSRPVVDMENFFKGLPQASHLRYDLTTDHETTSDLRIFAQARFNTMASERYIPVPWPEDSLLEKVVSQAAGLFMFVETIALALEHSDDPTEYLKATLDDSAGSSLTSLYKLYSSILNTRRVRNNSDFRRMIGVLLTATPLRDETLAELAGVRPDLVKTWVADLSSLLYRDEGANGGIRVRHLSISDFFFRDDCPSEYRVNLREANVDLGIACLNTMVEQLRFNICKLEDSRLANADVKDLPLRIKENISDALQYSSVYWSNHLCRIHDNGDERVWESLRKFFEGPYSLFWIEVLSIMGSVPIGVPSLRRVISKLVKVRTSDT